MSNPSVNPNVASKATSAETRLPQRLMSVDALRGFDMFWIIGADALVYALDRITHAGKAEGATSQGFAPLDFLARQMEHCTWAGFHFYDLIFPLFVFIVGVSIVFSLTKTIQQVGRAEALKRIIRRSILLFVVGILYSGGFSSEWPDIRLMGVLNRIALCYLFAGLIFCFCNVRMMIAISFSILVGYWAVMTYVPIRDIQLNDATFKKLSAETGLKEPNEIFQSVTTRVTAKYDAGYNLSDHLDFQYLPGRKYSKYYDPEGFISTFPAIVTCLFGVFAGLLLRNGSIPDPKKVTFLLAAGAIALTAGWLWNLQFPVVKKIWTSSFVLVAGGYSAMLLAVFFLVVDIWKYQKWCLPFVWMGMNSITIYLTSNVIGGFRKLAQRFVGGDIKGFFDHHLLAGSGDLLISVFGLLLAFLLVRFLYQKKIFLRL